MEKKHCTYTKIVLAFHIHVCQTDKYYNTYKPEIFTGMNWRTLIQYVDFVSRSYLHKTAAWNMTYNFNFFYDFCVKLISFYQYETLKFLDKTVYSESSSYCTVQTRVKNTGFQ